MMVNEDQTAAIKKTTRPSTTPLASMARAAARTNVGCGRGLRAAQVRARVARPGAGPGGLRMGRRDGERAGRAGRGAHHAGREDDAGHERAVAGEVGERVAEVALFAGRR